MTGRHKHTLLVCHDCDGEDMNCIYCDGRGYFEVCAECREPMGNGRRQWKREQATTEHV